MDNPGTDIVGPPEDARFEPTTGKDRSRAGEDLDNGTSPEISIVIKIRGDSSADSLDQQDGLAPNQDGQPSSESFLGRTLYKESPDSYGSLFEQLLNSLDDDLARNQLQYLYSRCENDVKRLGTLIRNKTAGAERQHGYPIPLQEVLAAEAEKRLARDEDRQPPSRETLEQIEYGLSRIREAGNRIAEFRQEQPTAQGTERWTTELTNLGRALGKARKSSDYESGVEGHIRGIEAVIAEIAGARSWDNVHEVRKPLRWQEEQRAQESEIDYFVRGASGNVMVDHKSGKPVEPGSSSHQKLLHQIDGQLFCSRNPAYSLASDSAFLVYQFDQGVYERVAESMEDKGVRVIGKRVEYSYRLRSTERND